ncbi:hypothetical protein FEM48_Zijuj06G0061800 [Ziziphus jujuba var. spinosa]|uniref:PORR domain-containing protein n=1 Tax=Ziziphus jujuba var. spinosa TaxID=714518 RepID=A0A978V7M1_ZIZJJ|nr:hypothetical protein FEM48_Zijuj06G0061800 [Ziziphus jujuba var. spinosa]
MPGSLMEDSVRVVCQMELSLQSRSILSEQLNKIFELCGSPNENNWPYVSKNPCKRVQDRSKMKRVHEIGIVTEKWKIASKVLFLMEILKKEPEMIISFRSLEQYRRQINLPKPHKVSFIRKSPKLFELYKDHRGVLWCGMTKLAEDLVEEEERILEENKDNVAEYVTRYGEKIEHFQKRCYWSSYADARGLKAGSLEFDERAVAVMHELLSFIIEKRLVTDHLTHFRREFVMPQKLMRLLLKHIGIFYVSERWKRFSVFVAEAYEG